MTTNVASLRAVLTADTSDFTRDMKAARESVRQFEREMKQQSMLKREIARQDAAAAKQAEANRRTLTNWAKNSALEFGGAAAAVGILGKKVYEFAKSGAQLKFIETRFDRVNEKVGAVSKTMLNELRIATKGTVDNYTLMKSASDLYSLGLVKNKEDIIRLSKVQAGLNMDTGELTLALANKTTRRFDQLGVSLDGFQKRLAALKASGMDADSAFTEAFLQQAEMQLEKFGNAADTSAGQFSRFEAGFINMWNAIKTAAPDKNMGALFGGQTLSNTLGQVGATADAFSMLMAGTHKFQNPRWDSETNQIAFDVVEKQVQDLSELWKNGGRQGRGFAINGLSAAQNYTAMAFAYGQPGAGPQTGPEAAPIDYAAQLAGGLQMSQINDQYANSVADLNQKLAEEQAALDLLAKQGYSPLGNKMQEQKRIVDSLKQAQTEQAQNYEQTADQMMLTMLETAGASDQMRLEYSKSSGLITEKAATQQAAMEEIAQALADGRINADEAAAAVSYLLEMLDNLDGKEVEATINLITNGNVPNIGNTPSGGGGQGGGGGASVYDPNRYDQMAGGGQLSAPLTEVGEQGPEFISSSGWVYTAAQTRAMKAAGMRPARGFRIGGDLAGTGVFGTEGAPGYASAVNDGSNRRADAVVEIAQSIGSMQSTSALQTAAMQNTMTMYQQQAQKTNDLLTALIAKTATAGAIGQSVAVNSVTYK